MTFSCHLVTIHTLLSARLPTSFVHWSSVLRKFSRKKTNFIRVSPGAVRPTGHPLVTLLHMPVHAAANDHNK